MSDSNASNWNESPESRSAKRLSFHWNPTVFVAVRMAHRLRIPWEVVSTAAGVLDMRQSNFDDFLPEQLIAWRCDAESAAGEIIGACQSPIEQVFFVSLTMQAPACGRRVAQRLNTDLHKGPDTRVLEWVTFAGGDEVPVLTVHQQLPVGKYRLDFAIVGGARPVAVELDGHDFHERTKEQAARDKSRDRDLSEAGWTVLRFTGSEIWKDPDACAEQAMRVACT